VRTVLSGRVSRLGDKLHVSAELASASNDSVLWSFSADRQTSDELERGVTIHSAWATGLWCWTSAFGKYLQQAHFRDIRRRFHDAPAAT